MNIILEGPDNSGKTYLAKQLAEYFNLEYTHSGGPPKNVLLHCRAQNIKLSEGNKILDRCTPISEHVYGKNLSNFEFYLQDFSRKAIFIYCRPSIEHLLDKRNQSLSEHDNEETAAYTNEDYARFIAKYDEIFKTVPHIFYNWTIEHTQQESIYDRIIESSMAE